MKRVFGFAVLLFVSIADPARAQSSPLDAAIDRAATTFAVPGAIVVAVRGDQVIYERPIGVLRLGKPERVTEHTRFAIGSITKSFTAAAVAKLVDEGRLSWDDKAVKYLPELKLHDDYPTRELTLRDMLAHRSGLASGAGDLLGWPETTISTAERIAALRALPLTRGFRARYGYSNILYMAVGKVIARASGVSWSDFVRTHFLTPLHMRDALADQGPTAWPHGRLQGVVRGIGPVTPLPRRYGLASDGAAGALQASGADMAHWISVQLAFGQLPDGSRLFSADAAREMHAIQTPLRIRSSEGAFRATDPNFSGYGLGWFVRDYHGEKLVYHAGGTLGGVSQVTLIPDRNIGFAILTNSEEAGFLRAVELLLLDHFLARPFTDWAALAKADEEVEQANALALLKESAARLPRGPASLPITAYAGRYRDAWFGMVSIKTAGNGLRIAFERSPFLAGRLEHVGGDVFRTRFDEPGMEDAYLTFRIADSRVAGARAAAVSPLADFSFDFKDLSLIREDRGCDLGGAHSYSPLLQQRRPRCLKSGRKDR